ncbi:unnamed protein product [marine sediment metagenome]|uniref:Uncharacterized protein n=1 Tax=marine sediment metagenome TaxID=412755 RepID=X0UHV4_9ZZZZ
MNPTEKMEDLLRDAPWRKVGLKMPKVVSASNSRLYLKFLEIVTSDDNQGADHMGRQGISALVDYLEKNYDLIPKGDR